MTHKVEGPKPGTARPTLNIRPGNAEKFDEALAAAGVERVPGKPSKPRPLDDESGPTLPPPSPPPPPSPGGP